MNKTTKIILCAAIPAGAASILIPTIVVASLKSKARKTEQERKLLSDLNLEVQDYLGKITNEVKDNDVQEYQELLELTSRMKNVINNKYLKKEDYKKQLLLLKEKFDSFKEKINPPRKNDTNENTDNTNNENVEDSSQPKTDKETNPQNENVSAYEQLKIELTKAEEFYKSISDEKYIDIKNEFRTYIDKIKETLNNSSSSQTQDKYLNAKKSLISKIESIKAKINDIKNNNKKILENELYANAKDQIEELNGKIDLFQNNLKEVNNKEIYKNNIFAELNSFIEKYKIDSNIGKTPLEIIYKSILLDHINDRYKNYKKNIDNSKSITKEILHNETVKLIDLFDSKESQLSLSINKEDLKKTLNEYLKQTSSNLTVEEMNKINQELSNIYLIFDFSMKLSKLHQKFSASKPPAKEKLTSKNNHDFDYSHEKNIIDLINEKTKTLKKANGWGNAKYLEYFDSFLEITKYSLKINQIYTDLKELYEITRKFNFIQTKLNSIYNDYNVSVTIENKENINKKIRNYINSISLDNSITSLDKIVTNINNDVEQIENNSNGNIQYIEAIEQRKNILINKLNKYSEIYDVNSINKLFEELKNYYKADQENDNYYIVRQIEDFFFKYEMIVENIDQKIIRHNNLLKKIENIGNENPQSKYSLIITNIKKIAKQIQVDKFRNIQDIEKVNTMLDTFINTLNESMKFIDKLPTNIERSREMLKSLISNVEKKFVSDSKFEYIKQAHKPLIDKLKENVTKIQDLDKLNYYIFSLTEYTKIINGNLSNIKNTTFTKLDNFNANEYFLKLVDEYVIKQQEITIQISNAFNHFNFDNIVWLKVVDTFCKSLILLNEEYEQKIAKYDEIYKKYNNKISELNSKIEKINKKNNAILIEKTILIMNMLEFAYKYVDNIFDKDVKDIKNMEEYLDSLIQSFEKIKL
ncbi:hypothetical protein PR244_00435 [Metamycoplasma hyosynoviae]|uniref:hypothetical protein n=1 Tax=Metamycoplasma hyosynoviae TaxID=29559 RepID=UPI00235940F9|nr:hypothetical protein [Metamycoplasma hyosynoviae]MDC8918830.1 hypothetical protein [Metamycoplasma hyosynoviae]